MIHIIFIYLFMLTCFISQLIEANQLFYANEKKSFTLEYCFELLQNERKWHEAYTPTTQAKGLLVDLEGAAIPLDDHR